jgi:outer membrane protein
MKNNLLAILAVSIAFSATPLSAQTGDGASPVSHYGLSSMPPLRLGLAEAESRALAHQPRLQAQILRAKAEQSTVTESRAAYLPQLTGNLTAVQANEDSVIAAGTLQTSSLSTHAAWGVSLSQLVTDFGRSTHLLHSARLSAQASNLNAEAVRLEIMRDVDEAYYALAAAESVRNTAQAVLDYRKVSLRQLTSLAESQLKSTLDVQFAQVLVSEAEKAMVSANSNVDSARAQLIEAMGDEIDTGYVLAEIPLPPRPDDELAVYLEHAQRNRPDLNAIRLEVRAAQQFSKAENRISYPTITVLGNAGEVPTHDSTLRNQYGAIGVNVSIPLFRGGADRARSDEARFKAQAALQDTAALGIRIARDVRVAWARSRDSYLQIDVAQTLVDQTSVAMRLAQARYEAGLGSVVELDQADLNRTSALISAASARFDYLRSCAELDYAVGIAR